MAWTPLDHDSKPPTLTGMNAHTETHTLTPTSVLYPNLGSGNAALEKEATYILSRPGGGEG